jgi:hypothetical protein
MWLYEAVGGNDALVVSLLLPSVCPCSSRQSVHFCIRLTALLAAMSVHRSHHNGEMKLRWWRLQCTLPALGGMLITRS